MKMSREDPLKRDAKVVLYSKVVSQLTNMICGIYTNDVIHNTQQRVQNVELFYEYRSEKCLQITLTVNKIVHLKALLEELLKHFNKVVQRKIKEQKYIVVAGFTGKYSFSFVQVLLNDLNIH